MADARTGSTAGGTVPTPTDPRATAAAQGFLAQTLALMGYDAAVSVRETPDGTVLEVHGPDAPEVVGKKGATLDALQLLCNRVGSRVLAGERAGLTVDAAGYRARREAQLSSRAQQLGQQCVQECKVITMEPLPPRERRVVHMALARFPGVTTQSEGDGEERRIQIIPMPVPRGM